MTEPLPSPDVQRLCDRLASAPRVFLAPVEPTEVGTVHVGAVVADLFRDRASRPLEASELAAFRLPARARPEERNAARQHLRVVLLASWLLHDRAFDGVDAGALFALATARLAELSTLVAPLAFIEDPDRREELVRTCLAGVGIAPHGESAADADDRLGALDSVRRTRLLQEARAREQQREQQRKKLEELRRQEEEERRMAARTTHED